jgi:hypothetical protein
VGREVEPSRQRVYRLVQRFGIDPDSFRSPAKTAACD